MGGHNKKKQRGRKPSHRDETASKKAKHTSASSSQPSVAWPQMMMPPQQMAGMMPQPWQMPPQHMMLPQQLQQQHMQQMPQPHMMQLPQQMMVPGAGLAAAPVAAPSADPPQPGAPEPDDEDDDSSGEEESDSQESDSDSSAAAGKRGHGKRYQKDAKAMITRSAAGLVQLPRVRLAELVEALAGLDSSVTAEWGETVSCRLIWVLTRVKPFTKISDLRVDSYAKLSSLLQRAHSRIQQSLGASRYHDKIKAVLGPSPSADVVETLATDLGFNEAWFDKVAAPKAKAKAKAAAPVQAAPAATQQGVALASPHAAAAAAAGAGPGRVERRLPPPPSFLQLLPAAPPAAAPALAAPVPDPALAAAAPVLAPVPALALAAPSPAPSAASSSVAVLPAGLSADDMQQALSMWAQHRRQQHLPQPPEPAAEREHPPAAGDASADGAVPQQHLPQPLEPAAEPEQPPAGDVSADGAVPQQEHALCCICQQGMGPSAESLSGAVEALACAHVFHSECLNSYCQATGKNRLNCCPYKCNADAFVAVMEEQQGGAVEAVAVAEADDDLPGLAVAEMERARANMF